MKLPLFCPNKECECHDKNKKHGNWFAKNDKYKSKLSGVVQRFKCRFCGKRFSEQTFSIDYYAKKKVDYTELMKLLVNGSGVRGIARSLGVSVNTVQIRVQRLGRQFMAFHAYLLDGIKLMEDLVADGFESFCLSQYFPNNIHLLVGKFSLFVYYMNSVTIRRKGAMTEKQKAKRAALERIWRADPQGIVKSFQDLLRVLLDLLEKRLELSIVLHTDKKLEYVRAMAHLKEFRELVERGVVVHQRTSSKKERTYSNPLFAVNYIDREMRKDLANHKRETTQWGRNENDMMFRQVIWMVWHNVWKPFKVNHRKGDDRTHATVAGLDAGYIERGKKGLFEQRRFLSHTKLPEYWEKVWKRQAPTPLDLTGKFIPKHVFW